MKKKTFKKTKTTNPASSIWDTDLTKGQKGMLAEWVKLDPQANKTNLSALMLWHQEEYGYEPAPGMKSSRGAVGDLCYTLGRRGARKAPEWLSNLGIELQTDCKENVRSGLKDSGRKTNPPKKKAKKKTTLKAKAKKAERKVKKVAKTDMGRAGIGGGIGALALGPIGAVIGAGYAISSKKKKGKKNPGPTCKLSTTMGNLLLDYHKAGEAVEHVAASALRGERVELRYVKTARADLKKIQGIQPNESEKEQIGDLVDALGRVIAKCEGKSSPRSKPAPKSNPARAFSLETEVNRSRQKKAKGAAGKHSRASSAASDAARQSLRKRMAALNPGSYRSQVVDFSDAKLDAEHKAASSLITRAKRHPDTSQKMVDDLVKVRGYITDEKKARKKRKSGRRGSSGHVVPVSNPKVQSRRVGKFQGLTTPHHVLTLSDGFSPSRDELRLLRKYKMMDKLEGVPASQIERIVARLKRQEKTELKADIVSNPTTVGRSKGKFTKLFTPDKEELRLLRKYKMMDKLEDVSASQIERIVTRLKRQEKEELKVEYPTVMDLAATYARARSRYQILITSPGTSPGDIARAKKKFDEAEDALALYAEIRNMDQKLLKEIVWHTKKKEREAKAAKPNPKPSRTRLAKAKLAKERRLATKSKLAGTGAGAGIGGGTGLILMGPPVDLPGSKLRHPLKSNPEHGPVRHIVAGGIQTSRRGFKPFFHPKDADPESILKASLFYVANKGKVSLAKLERKFGKNFVWYALLNEEYLRFDGAPAMSIEEIEKHFEIYPDNGLLVITPKGKKIADRARAELSSLSREEQEWEEHAQRPRDNPLSRVTEKTPEKKFRAAISRNIATEMKAGRPQKQAIAIALNQARTDAPKKATKIYGPKPNPSYRVIKPNLVVGNHIGGFEITKFDKDKETVSLKRGEEILVVQPLKNHDFKGFKKGEWKSGWARTGAEYEYIYMPKGKTGHGVIRAMIYPPDIREAVADATADIGSGRGHLMSELNPKAKKNPKKGSSHEGVTVIPMQLPAEAVNRMIKKAGRAIKAGKGDEEYGHWEKSLKEWGIPKKIAIDVADGKARIVGNLQDGYYHEYINPKKNPSSSKSSSKIKPDLYAATLKKFIKTLNGYGVGTTILSSYKDKAELSPRARRTPNDIVISADADLYLGIEVNNSRDFDDILLANAMDKTPEFEALWEVERSKEKNNKFRFIVRPRKEPKPDPTKVKSKKPSGEARLGEYMHRGLRSGGPRKETEEFVKGRQKDIFASMRKHAQSEVYDNPGLTTKVKSNPSGSNLKSLIANVAHGLESKSKPGVSAGRGFINQARTYARKDGFDGEAVFRSFQVYTLVGSKYSTLSSVRKTNYAKKKDIEKTIVKVARLISENADRSALTKAAVDASRQATEAAWTSARDVPRRSSRDAAWAAYAAADAADAAAYVSGTDAAHEAARNARESAWAADDGAWADSNTSHDTAHTPARGAMYADRANGLLNIMRKEAAKKNPMEDWIPDGDVTFNSTLFGSGKKKYFWAIQYNENDNNWGLWKHGNTVDPESGEIYYPPGDDQDRDRYNPWYSTPNGEFNSFREAELAVPVKDRKWLSAPQMEYSFLKSKKGTKRKVKKNPEPTLVTKGKIGIAKFKGQGKGLTEKDLAQLEEIKGNLEIHYELASLYTGAKAKNERARIKDSLRDVNELIRGARRRANPGKANPRVGSDLLRFSNRVRYEGSGPGPEGLGLKRNDLVEMEISRGRGTGIGKAFGRVTDVISVPNASFGKTIKGYEISQWRHGEYEGHRNPLSLVWERVGPWYGSGPGSYRKIKWRLKVRDDLYKNHIKDIFEVREVKRVGRVESDASGAPIQKTIVLDPRHREYIVFTETYSKAKAKKAKANPGGPKLGPVSFNGQETMITNDALGWFIQKNGHSFGGQGWPWTLKDVMKLQGRTDRLRFKGGLTMSDDEWMIVSAASLSFEEHYRKAHPNLYDYSLNDVLAWSEKIGKGYRRINRDRRAKTQKKNPLGRGSGNSGPSTDLKDYRISAHNMSDRVISNTFNKLKSSRDPVDRQKANILGTEMGVRDSVSRRRNPDSEWSLAHIMLLSRLFKKGMAEEQLDKRGKKALYDLRDQGLVEVISATGPYQDPKAGPEEGEVLLWDIIILMTPKGREYVRKHNIMKMSSDMTARAIAGMRAGNKKKPKKNPGDVIDLGKRRREKERAAKTRILPVGVGPPPIPKAELIPRRTFYETVKVLESDAEPTKAQLKKLLRDVQLLKRYDHIGPSNRMPFRVMGIDFINVKGGRLHLEDEIQRRMPQLNAANGK